MDGLALSNNLSIEKIQGLLNYISEEYPQGLDLLKEIISKVRYFPTQYIIEAVRSRFELFLSQHGTERCAIFVDNNKYGSEHFLITQIYDLIPSHFLIIANKDQLVDIDRIVLIDDAIYSGVHLMSLIDVNQFDSKISVVTALYTESGKNLLVSFRSENDKTLNIDFFCQTRIYTIRELFPDITDWTIYNELFYKYINDIAPHPETFTTVFENPVDEYPLYDPTTVHLQHKIANNHGTLQGLLETIVNKPPSRQVIVDSQKNAPQEIRDLFQN